VVHRLTGHEHKVHILTILVTIQYHREMS